MTAKEKATEKPRDPLWKSQKPPAPPKDTPPRAPAWVPPPKPDQSGR